MNELKQRNAIRGATVAVANASEFGDDMWLDALALFLVNEVETMTATLREFEPTALPN